MAESPPCRIRLRLPSGAELETEGAADFVRRESERLLGIIGHSPAAAALAAAPASPESLWKEVAEPQSGGLALKAKPASASLEEVCILLLGAAKTLVGQDKPTATQLARWLRQSGCPFKRLDRVLAEPVRKAEVLAYGFKRSRRYELTPAGQSKASLLAIRAAQALQP